MYYGDFAEDATVYIPFNTFSSDDPSASVTITDLADADIKVHKDGHIDQIVTDGATVVIDFDGITGNHMINIDTSVDAAYATGSEYQVRVEGTTVDGATINAWVGAFSIERAGGVLATLKTLVATVGAAGVGLSEAGGDGDHLTAIDLPNQTMDITGNLSGSVGSVTNDVGITQGDADKVWGTATRVLTAGTNLNNLAQSDILSDATPIDGGNVNTLSGHDPGSTICADGTPLTAAETESECNDALVVLNLDHLMKTVVADRDIMAEVVDGTVLANIMTKTDGDTSDFDPDTDSLEALRDRGDAAWVTGAGGSCTGLTLAEFLALKD